jgi:hypothetical protein
MTMGNGKRRGKKTEKSATKKRESKKSHLGF